MTIFGIGPRLVGRVNLFSSKNTLGCGFFHVTSRSQAAACERIFPLPIRAKLEPALLLAHEELLLPPSTTNGISTQERWERE